MTLLDALTWWPWSRTESEITDVRPQVEAPGLVTLAWCTDEERPTRIERRDGTPLFSDELPRRQHRVTLTGAAGWREEIVIRAGDFQRAVQIAF